MDMKQVILSLTSLLTATLAHARLTLDECQRQAQVNYPLVRRYGLIEKAREYDLSNAGKGYLPRFSLSGKATYQSDNATSRRNTGYQCKDRSQRPVPGDA